MSLVYGSVCSGVEAATVAWHGLGWVPAWFSQYDPEHNYSKGKLDFPSQVLAHHYPDVPNLGDMMKIEERPEFNERSIDLLVGGTPCQSFSIAGLRGGLDDARGNLALKFCQILARKQPRWFIWENVPGVLSSWSGEPQDEAAEEWEETSDFASICEGFRECGYSIAYRILDAQYFGVAQRRRLVFVVGYLGDWRPAAAVLFEPESLRGDPAPRRKTREEIAGALAASTFSGGAGGRPEAAAVGHFQAVGYTAGSFGQYNEGIGTLRAQGGDMGGGSETIIAFSHKDNLRDATEEICPTLLNQHNQIAAAIPIHDKATRHKGGGESRNGDGASNGLGIGKETDPSPTLDTSSRHGVFVDYKPQAAGFKGGQGTGALGYEEEIAPTITSEGSHNAHAVHIDRTDLARTLTARHDSSPDADRGMNVLAVGMDSEFNAKEEIIGTLKRCGDGGRSEAVMNHAMQVRRLTPVECERLQGFPDNYTNIPVSEGKMAADGPRYKAMGNSMAVPVMRWIGERIQLWEDIHGKGKK